MRKIFLMTLFFLLSCFSSALFAKELHGKIFKDEVQQQNIKFLLKGLGLKSYLFVKVFVAGFYVQENLAIEDVLSDVPKRLEVSYFYKIPGSKLAIETMRRIKLNTTQQEYKQIQDRVQLMNSYFVDLKPGDRYALSYIPNQGTFFIYNDQLLGKIEGRDFAKALFSVWVGQEPISQSLKESLVGNE